MLHLSMWKLLWLLFATIVYGFGIPEFHLPLIVTNANSVFHAITSREWLAGTIDTIVLGFY